MSAVLSGNEFNKRNKGKLFVKLTTEDENHNKYQFKTGLNEDTIKFNPSGECEPGGIYFCEYDKMHLWIRYGNKKMAHYRYVLIPSDAKVYCEKDKYKADKLVLTEKRKIFEDKKLCVQLVKRDGNLLKHIEEKNQTETICMAAVQEYAGVLYHVKNQTGAICMGAIQQNGYALQDVKIQTEAICMAAVQKHGLALQFVKNKTEAICMAAVQQDGNALRYVEKQTEAIIMAAVRRNGYALEHVKDQNEAICLVAVQQNGFALQFVKNKTEAICMAAVRNLNVRAY